MDTSRKEQETCGFVMEDNLDRGLKIKMGDCEQTDVNGDDEEARTVQLSRTRPLFPGRRRRLYQAPEFVKRLNAFEEAECGSTVIFECQWSGLPKPTIKWYKDDEEITENERYQYHDGDNGMLSLVIDEARKDDEGAYKCKAENQEGVASTTGYLSVTGEVADKPLSIQQRKTPDHCVSCAPPLRSIREQKTLESEEEEEMSNLPPSPIQEFLDSLPSNPRTGFIFPLGVATTANDAASSGSDTSVDSQDFGHVDDLEESTPDVINPPSTNETADPTPDTSHNEDIVKTIEDINQDNKDDSLAELNKLDRETKDEIIAAIVESEQAVEVTRIDNTAELAEYKSNLERVPSAEAISMFTQSITDDDDDDDDDEQNVSDTKHREDSLEFEPPTVNISPSEDRPNSTVKHIIKLVKQRSSQVEEQLRIAWLYYFAIISFAAFFGAATEFSPALYIIILAVISLISFRILVQTTCT